MRSRNNNASLSRLPPDIWVEIFSYLSHTDLAQVKKTSTYFNKLAMAPSLWTRIRVGITIPDKESVSKKSFLSMMDQKCVRNSDEHERHSTTDRRNLLTVQQVVRSVVENEHVLPECSVTGNMVYPNLRRLELSTYSKFEPSFFLKYGSLHYLDIKINIRPGHNLNTGSDNKALGLKQLFEGLGTLTKLETLKLQLPRGCKPNAADVRKYFCSGPTLSNITLWFEVSDDIVADILLHCSNLEQLALTSEVSAEAFKDISTRSKLTLTSLRLANCNSADNKLFYYASLAFPNLESVSLNYLQNKEKIVNLGLQCLLERCYRLTQLELHICSGSAKSEAGDDEEEEEEEEEGAEGQKTIANHYLFSLAHHKAQGNLQALSLNHFNSRHLPFLSKLFQNQCNLRKVGLFNCNLHDEDIQALAENCHMLQTLWILRNHRIHVSPRTVSALWNLPHLQTLKVDELSFTENLVNEGPRQRKRKLMSSELAKENGISRLKTLAFPSSSLVFTPSRLELFGRTCRGLQNLMIFENQHMNDENMKVILRCCVHLKELRLIQSAGYHPSTYEGNIQLSDVTLHNIQIFGKKLQALRLPHSPGFTLSCLTTLVVQCSSLTELIYAVFLEKVDSEAEEVKNMGNTLNCLVASKLAKHWGDVRKQVETQFPFELPMVSGTWVKFKVTRVRGSETVGRSLRPRKKMTYE